ncbi:MAG: transcription antitermination factor NusB [Acidobacteriota bacterium]
MGQRRRARELALQLLFEVEITRDPPAQVLTRFWAMREVPQAVQEFTGTLVLGTVAHLESIDRLLASAAKNWRLGRMAIVDRNVLRMAIFELRHRPETPSAVVIDEAIEIARKFGSEDSAPFINGVLDAVRQGIAQAGNET